MFIELKDLLVEDRLAPITTSMGFFESPYEEVARTFVEWEEELKRTGNFIKKVSIRQVSGSLEEVLKTLLPLKTNATTRHLFIPTRNGWTAYWDNGFRGTDPAAI